MIAIPDLIEKLAEIRLSEDESAIDQYIDELFSLKAKYELERFEKKEKAINHIKEYCNKNKHISFRDEPFPKNHLYCNRNEFCEYAEHQQFIDVYIY